MISITRSGGGKRSTFRSRATNCILRFLRRQRREDFGFRMGRIPFLTWGLFVCFVILANYQVLAQGMYGGPVKTRGQLEKDVRKTIAARSSPIEFVPSPRLARVTVCDEGRIASSTSASLSPENVEPVTVRPRESADTFKPRRISCHSPAASADKVRQEKTTEGGRAKRQGRSNNRENKGQFKEKAELK